jgi:hypothetical protein
MLKICMGQRPKKVPDQARGAILIPGERGTVHSTE